MNQARHKAFEAKGEALSSEFKGAILKRDGSKVFRAVNTNFLREENNKRLVYRPEIR